MPDDERLWNARCFRCKWRASYYPADKVNELSWRHLETECPGPVLAVPVTGEGQMEFRKGVRA